MPRNALRRGVSACTLIICTSGWLLSPATAQQSLPTINVGGTRVAQPARGPAGNPMGPSSPSSAPTGSASGPRTAAQIWSPNLPDGRWAKVEKYQIPNPVILSVTRQQIDRQINIVNSQDAVKYLPSLYVSENRGGTQGSLQTRSFANSTERNLVYLDEIPLNSLVGRGGQGGFYGGLQTFFKLVSPEEIERVDYISGPFAAQYGGRSMGGVLTYTTKMPDKLRITAKETVAVMDYDWARTQRAFPRSLTEITAGDRWGNFSWFLSTAYNTYQYPPAAWVPLANNDAPPIYNEFLAWNRTGFPQRVVGIGGMFDTDLTNTKLKLAYDFLPTLRLAHTVGVFTEDRNVYGETLYSNNNNRWFTWFGPRTNRNPTGYGNFASFYGRHQNSVLVNALSLRQNTGGVFDFDLAATHFYLMHDVWNTPLANVGTTASNPVGGFTSTGLVRKETGDYWATLDLKGIYRPFGPKGAHEVSFGLYGDQAHVVAPTYQSLSWPSGESSNIGRFYTTIAKGTTRTQALWAQEVWRFHPDFKLTLGIRGEHWSASDGFNQANTAHPSGAFVTAAGTPIFQPYRAHTRFSPKSVLEWKPIEDWTISGAVGMANRFPVLSELYALTTPQGFSQAVNPNPNLRPEVSFNKELTIRRDFKSGGWMRVSLFHDDVRDFIVSQLVAIPGALVPASATANIERVRNMGVEVDLRKNDVLIEGLDVYANAVYLASHIVSNRDYIPALTSCRITGAGAANLAQSCWLLNDAGKRVPGLPDWRWKAGFIFKPDDRWSFAANVRWAPLAWQTTSNNDVSCCGLAQSFTLQHRLFSVDAKVNYRWNDRFTFDFGVDNIGNYNSREQVARTFYAAMRYKFEEGQKGGNGIFFAGDEAGLPDVSHWFRPVALLVD
ncbi:MAG: TonB-dependent receptor [Alphaproteobacteria bacterium]|nr:TonB-dependent receptor [Alphaproteobacteria bacterium]